MVSEKTVSGKTFLITGATGRLGCEAVNRLEELGATVIPIVLEGYGNKPELVDWTSSSSPISIKSNLDLLALPKVDYVLNFHWCVNRNITFAEQFFFEINFNLYIQSFFWEWMKNNCRRSFVNISSIKVFSPLNSNPITRDTEPRPETPYGIAKLSGEKYFDAFFSNSRFGITHLRLGSTAAFKEFPTQMISQLCDSAFNKKRIKVNHHHSTYLIYIKEAIDIIISAAVSRRFGKYIITKAPVPNILLVRKFEEISGNNINAEYADIEPYTIDPVFVSDIQLFSKTWIRNFSLDEMLEDYLKYYTKDVTVS